MPPEVVQNLRANPVLAGNVKELQRLQESLPGVVADVYRAKKEGRRPSEEQLRQGCAKLRLYCQGWDALQIRQDGLLTMTLAKNGRHPERKRVVCPAAIRRELIWDAHKQAHAGVQRVLTKLQLRWYWPRMGRDVWLRVRQCEICQASNPLFTHCRILNRNRTNKMALLLHSVNGGSRIAVKIQRMTLSCDQSQ